MVLSEANIMIPEKFAIHAPLYKKVWYDWTWGFFYFFYNFTFQYVTQPQTIRHEYSLITCCKSHQAETMIWRKSAYVYVYLQSSAISKLSFMSLAFTARLFLKYEQFRHIWQSLCGGLYRIRLNIVIHPSRFDLTVTCP